MPATLELTVCSKEMKDKGSFTGALAVFWVLEVQLHGTEGKNLYRNGTARCVIPVEATVRRFVTMASLAWFINLTKPRFGDEHGPQGSSLRCAEQAVPAGVFHF
jgi:hypothetical protein